MPVLQYLRRRDCIEAIVLVMAEEGAPSWAEIRPPEALGQTRIASLVGRKLGKRVTKGSPMCFDTML